jgi:hypothetical protein
LTRADIPRAPCKFFKGGKMRYQEEPEGICEWTETDNIKENVPIVDGGLYGKNTKMIKTKKISDVEKNVVKGKTISKPSLYCYVVNKISLDNARREGFGDDVKAWNEHRHNDAIRFMESL